MLAIITFINFSKEEASRIIKEELSNKEKHTLPVVKKVIEPISVKTKEVTIKSSVEIPKIALGLKVSSKEFKLSDLELDLYFNMLTTILFGASSIFREKTRQDKLLSSIYTEWESINNFKTFYLMSSTINPDKLIIEIKKVLKELPIDNESFERIKKVWIANEVKIYDNVDLVVNNSYDDILKYEEIVPNRIDIIKKMKFKKLVDLVEKIDFNNISIVKMVNNKRNI